MKQVHTRQYISKARLVLCIIALIFLADSDHVFAVANCTFGDDIPTTRPNPEAGPTEMRIAFFIFDIVEIDTKNQKFTLEVFIDGKWKDKRLGKELRTKGIKICETPADDIWRPDLLIINSLSIRLEQPEVFYVHDNGTVEGKQRITGTFSASFDLTRFPMDSQILPMTFISLQHGPDDLKILFEEGGMEKSFTEQGWEITQTYGKTSIYEMELIEGLEEDEREALSRFDYIIEAKRSTSYLLWKIVPLCLIVCASWVAFWIDPRQLGIRTGIGTVMIIAIIAFLFSTQYNLPQTDYLTRMDIFVYCSLILVFLTFIMSVTMGSLTGYEGEDLARRIEKWCRVIFPVAFSAIIAWLWWG